MKITVDLNVLLDVAQNRLPHTTLFEGKTSTDEGRKCRRKIAQKHGDLSHKQ
jgi:hypothetical protein